MATAIRRGFELYECLLIQLPIVVLENSLRSRPSGVYSSVLLSRTSYHIISYHIKTWQLTTSADQLRAYKIDAKYNIKHNIGTKCENSVLKTGRSLDVS